MHAESLQRWHSELQGVESRCNLVIEHEFSRRLPRGGIWILGCQCAGRFVVNDLDLDLQAFECYCMLTLPWTKACQKTSAFSCELG